MLERTRTVKGAEPSPGVQIQLGRRRQCVAGVGRPLWLSGPLTNAENAASRDTLP